MRSAFSLLPYFHRFFSPSLHDMYGASKRKGRRAQTDPSEGGKLFSSFSSVRLSRSLDGILIEFIIDFTLLLHNSHHNFTPFRRECERFSKFSLFFSHKFSFFSSQLFSLFAKELPLATTSIDTSASRPFASTVSTAHSTHQSHYLNLNSFKSQANKIKIYFFLLFHAIDFPRPNYYQTEREKSS